LALVDGQPPDRRGRIEAPLGRDPRHRQRMAIVSPSRGREASTEYRVQQLFPAHALLEVRPRTGRTHQIRVHLAFLDCPVSGDRVYGRRSARPIAARQMLHAWKLRLRLPGGPDVLQEFEAPLPSDMIRAIETAAAG
jgi:23S rRNA pseudouridine1911/1915/1917 synthase